MKTKLYCDGGARGNPGPAAAAAIIKTDSKAIRMSKFLGKATNNQAEYEALILGLKKAKILGAKEVDIFLDSELIVKQLKLKYKIKNQGLGPLFIKVWNLVQGFKRVNFQYIPREKNAEADKLVNRKLDRVARGKK